MKKILLILLLPALAITGCSDDDQINTAGLEGSWSLVEIHNGFGATNIGYDEGIVIWTFDEQEREIDVVNSASADNYSALATGNYGYTIGAENQVCNDALFIEEDAYGCISITNDTLRVSSAHVDGDILTFVR
ncbi:hypothetical protein FMM05_01680 [Flavobacterium zepuense]|uniref:Lipocalin-like domain-containing protein n=1 Tax=Flavobacterium zepuense TaxID=2593302 RepID=A0A552VA81_9FLAO|nr:hypothetical protein [Flavobacterium zepuense]TRW27374.1 hypothetical protein FMM05_01680 [Flavobacterium zepuense]